MTASYSPSSRGNGSRRAPIPSRRSLSVYRSLLAWHSIAYYWLIGWSQLCIRGHADAHPSSPTARLVACLDVDHPSRRRCRRRHMPLLSLLLAKFASSTSPHKPPETYMRVNDFGPHVDSIFRGRLIRESDLYASIYGRSKVCLFHTERWPTPRCCYLNW